MTLLHPPTIIIICVRAVNTLLVCNHAGKHLTRQKACFNPGHYTAAYKLSSNAKALWMHDCSPTFFFFFAFCSGINTNFYLFFWEIKQMQHSSFWSRRNIMHHFYFFYNKKCKRCYSDLSQKPLLLKFKVCHLSTRIFQTYKLASEGQMFAEDVV